MSDIFDCIIIGAGPAGSFLAKQLVSKNLKVLLLEEHLEVGRPVSCTGIISKKIFDNLNISEEVVLNTINSVKFFSPSLNSVNLSKENGWAVVVDRAKFDSALVYSSATDGVVLKLESKVINVKEDLDGVTVFLENNIEFKTKTCVIATGANSNLPYTLGFRRPWYYLKGAQIEVEFDVKNKDLVEIYFGKELCGGEFFWVVPIKENKARIGICSLYNAKNYLEVFLQKSFIKKRLSDNYKIESGIVPVGGIEENGRKHSRIFTVGDSAGHVKPTTAGGIALGFKSGLMLSEIISQMVLNSDFDNKYSKKYYKKIQRSIGMELLACDFCRALYTKMDDKKWDEIIKIAGESKLINKLNKSIEFDNHSLAFLRGLAHPKYIKIAFSSLDFSMLKYIRRAVDLWI
jgi:digeranylgeranylglycerophospholipid reductase